jgi:Icc-related predicted phosphoesterase
MAHITRILCAADPRGSTAAIDRLLGAGDEHDAQAIVLIGDLSGDGDKDGDFRSIFGELARTRRPTYWVPGPGDAPMGHVLREAHNIEIVGPALRAIHGVAALSPGGQVAFAGFGGEVSDDPDIEREEHERLRYPRWEPEYHLKTLRELDELQLVLAFATPPAHPKLPGPGSDVLAELIGTYRPRLVVCGGPRGTEHLGRSLIVAPGRLADGQYALADLHAQRVAMHELMAA